MHTGGEGLAHCFFQVQAKMNFAEARKRCSCVPGGGWERGAGLGAGAPVGRQEAEGG